MSLRPADNQLPICRHIAHTRLGLVKPTRFIDGESMVMLIAGDFPGSY